MNKQTNSAMGMLINAYRGILKNSRFESMRDSLISRNKCLHAGFIALLCTAALAVASSPAYAATITTTVDDLQEDLNKNIGTWSGNTFTITDDDGLNVRVSGDNNAGFEIDNLNKDTTIQTTSGNISITSFDVDSGIHISDSTHSLTFDSAENINISAGNHAVFVDDAKLTLTATGTITITSTSKNDTEDGYDGDAIYVSGNSDVNVSGSAIYLNTAVNKEEPGSDGIYTDSGSNGEVNLTAGAGGITIRTGNNGIDHRGSGDVKLTTTGTNLIYAGYKDGYSGGTESEILNDKTFSHDQDGMRIAGAGSISLSGAHNKIFATDAGLYIHNDANSSSTITLEATSGNNKIFSQRYGISATDGQIKLNASGENIIYVYANDAVKDGGKNTEIASVMLTGGADMTVSSGDYSGKTVNINPNNVNTYGINLDNSSEDTSNFTVPSGTSFAQTAEAYSGSGNVEAVRVVNNATLSGKDLTTIDFTATNKNTSGDTFGVDVHGSKSKVDLSGQSFTVTATSEASGDVFGISATDSGDISVNTTQSNGVKISATSTASGDVSAINATNNGNISITDNSSGGISISATAESGQAFAIHASSGGNISVESESSTEFQISANKDESGQYGTGIAIKSDSSEINLTSSSSALNIFGAVHATGTLGKDSANINASGEAISIQSHAVIESAGDLENDKSVFSAVYAEDGAKISLSGTSISLKTQANPENDNELERVVWAYNGEGSGSSITMDGHIDITTDNYEYSPVNLDVAVAAGTAVNLDYDTVNNDLEMSEAERAQVNINYTRGENYSNIEGDILAAYAGVVNINPQDSTTRADELYGINITGDLLAGNGGVMNVDIGSGTLEGRIDDYGEAGYSATEDSTSTLANGENGWTPDAESGQTFRNPAFSSEIYRGGAVNLTMGDNSVWKVTKQSWVTSITTKDTYFNKDTNFTDDWWGSDSDGLKLNAIPLIDLTSIEVTDDKGAALTVYQFNGDAQFRMHLDGDRTESDMLYIKEANGDYVILLDNPVTSADIENGDFDNLRFATVGAGSNVTFRVFSLDAGLYNLEYKVGQDARTPDEYEEGEDISVGQDSHKNNSQNVAYDGAAPSEGKPGAENVNNFFDGNGTVPSTGEANPSTTADTEGGLTEDTNFALELTGQGPAISESLSDAGKTVLSMSRANYFNAIYMDTLNKRQGQAHFADPNQDDGMWVRMRFDNLGQEGEFRSHNTMVEIGYDRKAAYDSGDWHFGAALDYMHGQTDYNSVNGDGELDRLGAWLYGTWLGDDGQYLDLILKYGHIENDFEVATPTNGNVTGSYGNDVYSLSAEYGYKFADEDSGIFFEPQVQLQYAHVTGADYTTSQDTKVDVEAIDSLIGRAGFRFGADLAQDTTPVALYLRADVMHEFMGDQDISASDDTGYMSVSYDNDDTWYDVGLGFSVKAHESTYFFMEAEKLFGANYSDTYIFSIGARHSF